MGKSEKGMGHRKSRILLGRLGEGYKESLLNLAKAFGDAGFEVIFTELQDPESIVRAAIQESVDHIGITTLPGTDLHAFEEMRRILAREGVGDMIITAGGFLDDGEIRRIKEMGVIEFFPRGTSFRELIAWAKRHVQPREP
jgi:methylmalonyl-CoA mutase C-terminal domain/subunit